MLVGANSRFRAGRPARRNETSGMRPPSVSSMIAATQKPANQGQRRRTVQDHRVKSDDRVDAAAAAAMPLAQAHRSNQPSRAPRRENRRQPGTPSPGRRSPAVLAHSCSGASPIAFAVHDRQEFGAVRLNSGFPLHMARGIIKERGATKFPGAAAVHLNPRP